MKVLYIDVLFLINFCLDYMALHIAGVLLHRKRQMHKLAVASLFGALYATVAALFPGSGLVQGMIGLSVSAVMTGYVYGGHKSGFAKSFVTFYAVSLLLGGIITVVYSAMNRYMMPNGGGGAASDKRTVIFFLAAAAGGILIRLCGMWLSKTPRACHECYVTVILFGHALRFRALLDSGNLLTDPLSGRKVVVVGVETVKRALPPPLCGMLEREPPDPTALPYEIAKRVRLIPTEGVGGRRLLVGLLPDGMLLEYIGDDGKKRRCEVDAVLAIDTESRTDYGGCEAVLPMSLAA